VERGSSINQVSVLRLIAGAVASSPFHQKGYEMKSMDFSGWLGVRRRHNRSYGNDEQQRQTGKGTTSYKRFGETDY